MVATTSIVSEGNSELLPTAYPITDWNAYCQKGKQQFFCDFYKRDAVPKKNVRQFTYIRTIGLRPFGRIVLVGLSQSNYYYTIKVIDKRKLIEANSVHLALNEKRILQSMKFPFCIHLEYFHMDDSYLYLVMPFVQGGDLNTWLRRRSREFSIEVIRFLGAQMLLALEYLHTCCLVYRDLKPENILLDSYGYLKLADFSLCKSLKETSKTYTFCGTLDYLAPEIILNCGYGYDVDWWSFGAVLYEMHFAVPPFHDSPTADILFKNILSARYTSPKKIPIDLRELIDRLLVVDATKRLGCGKYGMTAMKRSSFFAGIDWLRVVNRRMESPLLPCIKHRGDSSNFDRFPEEPFMSIKYGGYGKEFEDF